MTTSVLTTPLMTAYGLTTPLMTTYGLTTPLMTTYGLTTPLMTTSVLTTPLMTTLCPDHTTYGLAGVERGLPCKQPIKLIQLALLVRLCHVGLLPACFSGCAAGFLGFQVLPLRPCGGL